MSARINSRLDSQVDSRLDSQASLHVPLARLAHGKDLPLPSYATAQSAGMDLYAAVMENMTLEPGEYALVPTGLSMALPHGYEGQVRPRSGLALRHGLSVLNAPGTIDADYRGEVGVLLINHGKAAFVIERGLRIAQLIIAPVTTISWQETDQLCNSPRGQGGFGSTGSRHQKNNSTK